MGRRAPPPHTPQSGIEIFHILQRRLLLCPPSACRKFVLGIQIYCGQNFDRPMNLNKLKSLSRLVSLAGLYRHKVSKFCNSRSRRSKSNRLRNIAKNKEVMLGKFRVTRSQALRTAQASMGWGCRLARIACEASSYIKALKVAILAAYRHQVYFIKPIVNPMRARRTTKAGPRQDPKFSSGRISLKAKILM